jgi:hypothetical protein
MKSNYINSLKVMRKNSLKKKYSLQFGLRPWQVVTTIFKLDHLDYRGVAGAWGEKKFFKVSLPTVKQVSPSSTNQGFDLIEDTDIPVTLSLGRNS